MFLGTRGVHNDSIRFPIRYWPSVECRTFNIRSTLLRMSDFRHSINHPSNVEHSTFDQPFVECRIFDILFAVRRMLNIFDIRSALHRTSDLRHSISRLSNVEYSTCETRPIECRIFKIRPVQDVVCNF